MGLAGTAPRPVAERAAPVRSTATTVPSAATRFVAFTGRLSPRTSPAVASHACTSNATCCASASGSSAGRSASSFASASSAPGASVPGVIRGGDDLRCATAATGSSTPGGRGEHGDGQIRRADRGERIRSRRARGRGWPAVRPRPALGVRRPASSAGSARRPRPARGGGRAPRRSRSARRSRGARASWRTARPGLIGTGRSSSGTDVRDARWPPKRRGAYAGAACPSRRHRRAARRPHAGAHPRGAARRRPCPPGRWRVVGVAPSTVSGHLAKLESRRAHRRAPAGRSPRRPSSRASRSRTRFEALRGSRPAKRASIGLRAVNGHAALRERVV